METQLKREVDEDSLCFETSGDHLASLSLLEKYDRFIQKEVPEVDSDSDFFPDDTLLKEEYAQLRLETAKHVRTKSIGKRLSSGLPGRYRKSLDTNISVVDDDEPSNLSIEHFNDREQLDHETSVCPSERLRLLIEDLDKVRRCEPDGNSIFCTKEEWETIQEKYTKILDFMFELSSCFEKTIGNKEEDEEEEHETDRDTAGDKVTCKSKPEDQGHTRNNVEKDEELKLLAQKMESVQKTRDKFYEVEQQVKEQIEQLELVERYKMESVG